jgi:phosphoglycolate phosphatase
LFPVVSGPRAESVLTLTPPDVPTGCWVPRKSTHVVFDNQRLGFAVVTAILVLWDIDHTLIENHGVNKETYALAFKLLTGRETEYRARTDGRTEPEIMRDMLAQHGITPTGDHVARMLEALESATLTNAVALRERGHELPGARDVLAAFQASAEIIQSVLSGNIRPNAVTKLSAFGLEGFMDFEVGGYGSDDEVRANLVAVAQARATTKYRETFDKANTVLVGDTPRDVRAGLDGGARVVGVATGSDSVESLRAAGAGVVLPDLRDTRAVAEAVTSLAG